jgi:hypothetical protein
MFILQIKTISVGKNRIWKKLAAVVCLNSYRVVLKRLFCSGMLNKDYHHSYRFKCLVWYCRFKCDCLMQIVCACCVCVFFFTSLSFEPVQSFMLCVDMRDFKRNKVCCSAFCCLDLYHWVNAHITVTKSVLS